MAQKSNRNRSQSRLLRQISLPSEVHLRQMKVRPALEMLDRYLSDAVVAGHPEVRVIHGKGTGTLKNAVLKFLSDHTLVSSHFAAGPSEGNGGVTIAKLK